MWLISKKAINNINLDIKGNTMAAFVGHSGAGKSTIIKENLKLKTILKKF